jgi:hypothetical protein
MCVHVCVCVCVRLCVFVLAANVLFWTQLIARSFLACCSRDAKGQQTKVLIRIANEEASYQSLVFSLVCLACVFRVLMRGCHFSSPRQG